LTVQGVMPSDRRIAPDRLEHHIYGRIGVGPTLIDRVVLNACFSVCSNCGRFKPLSEFGLLTDKESKTVRNQPQCRDCRADS